MVLSGDGQKNLGMATTQNLGEHGLILVYLIKPRQKIDDTFWRYSEISRKLFYTLKLRALILLINVKIPTLAVEYGQRLDIGRANEEKISPLLRVTRDTVWTSAVIQSAESIFIIEYFSDCCGLIPQAVWPQPDLIHQLMTLGRRLEAMEKPLWLYLKVPILLENH